VNASLGLWSAGQEANAGVALLYPGRVRSEEEAELEALTEVGGWAREEECHPAADHRGRNHVVRLRKEAAHRKNGEQAKSLYRCKKYGIVMRSEGNASGITIEIPRYNDVWMDNGVADV